MQCIDCACREANYQWQISVLRQEKELLQAQLAELKKETTKEKSVMIIFQTEDAHGNKIIFDDFTVSSGITLIANITQDSNGEALKEPQEVYFNVSNTDLWDLIKTLENQVVFQVAK